MSYKTAGDICFVARVKTATVEHPDIIESWRRSTDPVERALAELIDEVLADN